MLTPLPYLLSACAALFADDSALELRYKGQLEQVNRTEENTEVKQFDLYCLLREHPMGAKIGFLVEERGGGGWAWPERFGQIDLNKKLQPTGETQIRILYNHEGTRYPLPLRQPLFEYADKLAPAAEWTVGKKRYEVQRTTKRDGRTCWEIDVFTNFGKRETIWVEDQTGLVVAAKTQVTVGRGDAFELLMELDSLKAADPQKLEATQTALDGLLKLQDDLKRRKNAVKPELSKDQLAATKESLESLSQKASGTPFQQLVGVISRDLKLQTQRDDNVDALAKRIVGKKAPEFELKKLGGESVNSKDLSDQIVVLHFWKYHEDPLTEPYGQVGYLDFLAGKRNKLGVSFFGVAVDPRLDKPAEAEGAKRDFRKFREFMNLSYPLLLGTGDLLEKLGDPRDVKAPLPLWIVIDHHGKVAHYKSGFYEIDPNKGLEELDKVLIPLIRQRRAEQVEAKDKE